MWRAARPRPATWCPAVSRRSRRPRVLQVCHSDAGRVSSLCETLPFCSGAALRSLPRWSACRCRQTAGLCVEGRRSWLKEVNVSHTVVMFNSQVCFVEIWKHLLYFVRNSHGDAAMDTHCFHCLQSRSVRKSWGRLSSGS